MLTPWPTVSPTTKSKYVMGIWKRRIERQRGRSKSEAEGFVSEEIWFYGIIASRVCTVICSPCYR